MRCCAPALALLTVLAAGCGGSHPSGKGHSDPAIGSPVPSPKSTEEPKVVGRSPSVDAPFLTRIRYRLEDDTVKMAGAAAKTGSTCDRPSLPVSKGATAHCTVVYVGLRVPWTVTVQGTASDVLVPYDATPGTGILTRAGILRTFYVKQSPYGTDLRCADLPEKVLVPLDKRTPYRCQYTSRPGEHESAMRITLAVIAKRTGPDFELPYDVH